MVMDLRKCVGCQTCTVACEVENFLPRKISWGRVEDYEEGEYPNVRRTFLPMPCMHCEEPACEKVCPTKATQRREDGIVTIDYDKCLGCRYCMVACPYEARSYLEVDEEKIRWPGSPLWKGEFRSEPQLLKKGVVSKCTFCIHRIDKAKETGKIPGKDPDVTPMCVNSCVGDARYFGDLDDPDSEVSKLACRKRAFRLHEEAGTTPSVYYLL